MDLCLDCWRSHQQRGSRKKKMDASQNISFDQEKLSDFLWLPLPFACTIYPFDFHNAITLSYVVYKATTCLVLGTFHRKENGGTAQTRRHGL